MIKWYEVVIVIFCIGYLIYLVRRKINVRY
jgi:hypothetical protein